MVRPACSTALTCQGLAVSRGPCVLLRDVSLTVAPGEILHVLGANGCGKSTFLQSIAGLEPFVAGVVTIGGELPAGLLPAQLARRRLLLPQRQIIPFELHVLDYLGIGWEGCGFDAQRLLGSDGFIHCCHALDLAPLLDREIHHLSGGEWQRVRLAGVLTLADQSLNPDVAVVLLDEPFGALDLGHKAALLGYIRGLADAGTGFVIVHHEPALSFAHADRVALFGEGRLLVCDQPQLALGPEWLARALGVASQFAMVGDARVLVTDLELRR